MLNFYKAAMTLCFIVTSIDFTFSQSYTSLKNLDEADLSIPWMKETLHLDDVQVHAVTKLNTKYALRFDSIRYSNADRTVKFQKTYQVISQRDNELKYILTEKQFTQYYRKKRKRPQAPMIPVPEDTTLSVHRIN